ncbi:MAG: tyrosine-type recombinase/integrase [Pseudomonadota bacterium]
MTKAANNITSKTGRVALVPRREPYWSRLEAGGFLGYRAMASGEGTWIARHRDVCGKQHYHALGAFKGPKAYDDARKAAEDWLQSCGAGVITTGYTVGDACKDYVAHLNTQKGKDCATDAEGRFKHLVYDIDIAAIRLDRLTATVVRKWVSDQLPDDDDDEDETRRAKDTANRNLASFKAALNFAYASKRVGTDAAWKIVAKFKDVGRRRQHYLTIEERRALITQCPTDLAELARGLLLTGLRPGELAKATVANFDKQQGTLVVSGKTGTRVVSLSSAAATYFKGTVKGRIASAPLVARADGSAWNKDAWKKPFRAAVSAAKLPSGVVLYCLRHTAISELVGGGMDAFLVARLAGTSTEMIDKHYGHLRHETVRAKMDAVCMV